MRLLTPLLVALLHLLFTLQLLTIKFLLVCTYQLLWDLHTLPPKTTHQQQQPSPHLHRDIPSHLYALPTIFTLLLILTVSSHLVFTFRHSSSIFGSSVDDKRTLFKILEFFKAIIWGAGLQAVEVAWGVQARETEREAWPKGHQFVFAGVVTAPFWMAVVPVVVASIPRVGIFPSDEVVGREKAS